MLQHGLGVEIRDQKADVVSLHRLPPQYEKGLGALRQEPGELVHEDILNFIRLLDTDADADRVDGGFDQDPLVLVARDREWVQEEFRGAGGFNLGDVVTFDGLRGEVAEGEGRSEGSADAGEVRTESY